MCSLVVQESTPRSAHNAKHGRATWYAGGLGVLDVQPSGMPVTASLTPAGPASLSIGVLHPQRLDPFIAWTYAYGQPNTHGYSVYYPTVPSIDTYGTGYETFAIPFGDRA
jgi:hypothetical protein